MSSAESATQGSTTSSGDAEVDRILGALDRLDAAPVTEHAGLLLDVHDRLSAELSADLSTEPSAGPSTDSSTDPSMVLNAEPGLRGAGAHGAP